jgi:hypothetical protein
MTKLVFVTQQIDREHPTLGAAADMVAALAARFDEVVVLAAAAAVDTLPANVHFRSFAAPTQILRGLRFEAALARELVRGRPSALLAHMSPIYAVLAAPLLRPVRVPLLLWFTQQQGGPNFYRSLRVVDTILSVDERSVPVASPKIRAIGHGIDTDGFECTERARRDGARLLSLGRYSAALVSELGLEERVRLLDAVPRVEVPRLLAEADVLVNATHGMSADKVVFEALAACTPVVAASPVFDGLLPPELRFTDGDPAGLASAIRAATALPDTERRRLRARVEAEHSVGHWADEVVATIRLARG